MTPRPGDRIIAPILLVVLVVLMVVAFVVVLDTPEPSLKGDGRLGEEIVEHLLPSVTTSTAP